MAKRKSTFSTLKEFKAAVQATKSLMTDMVVKVRVLSDGMVDINLDDQRFQSVEIEGIEKKSLKRLLNTEIPVVINAILQEHTHDYLESFLPGDEYSEDEKVKKEFEKKISFVEEEIISSRLQHQAQLKEISKNDILDEIRWDIGYKCHDLEKGTLKDIQFATVQFVLNEGKFSGSFPFRIRLKKNTKEPKSFTVDMHLEDIEQFIDDLSILKENLEKVQSKGNNCE